MSQYLWTSAEAMLPTTREDEEVVTGDKKEDLPLEGMYPPQDMGVLLHASLWQRRTLCVQLPLKEVHHLQ